MCDKSKIYTMTTHMSIVLKFMWELATGTSEKNYTLSVFSLVKLVNKI